MFHLIDFFCREEDKEDNIQKNAENEKGRKSALVTV